MSDSCIWCSEKYEITPVSEQRHLLRCKVFQSMPVAEWYGNKPFVRMPEPNDHILVEKTPIALRAVN